MFDATDPAADPSTPDAAGPRIGVFICHCGGNISDVVDVKRVADETRAACRAWSSRPPTCSTARTRARR